MGSGCEEKAEVGITTWCQKQWKANEEEVKAWVEANWEKWEDEKPEWFDDAMRARVPVEYIPESGDARKRESVRRASVGGADGGDIKEVGSGRAKESSVMPDEDEDNGE